MKSTASVLAFFPIHRSRNCARKAFFTIFGGIDFSPCTGIFSISSAREFARALRGQNGKLFYQRQEAYVSPPVRVCDIKLCHVKSCLKDSDLRFSFEIISPKQRTYLLQARMVLVCF